jgi:acyl-CoA thioesterase I
MEKRRIVIIASSMAMPRPGVTYESTWVYKLIHALPECEFIDKTRRASTTDRLISEGGGDFGCPRGADLLEFYMPDIVVMQIGITDFAPRYFKKGSLEKIIVSKLLPKSLANRYVQYVKRQRVRDPQKAYVSPHKFRANCRDYLQRAKRAGAEVFIILIAPVTNLFVEKSPHINQNITIYNRIYKNMAREFQNVVLIQPFGMEVNLEEIATDEFHVNTRGHEVIFQKVRDRLCQK